MDLKGIDKHLSRVERALEKSGPAAPEPRGASQGADHVQLSSEAQDILSIFDAVRTLAAAPAAVREERVQEVRVRIADGYYDRPQIREAAASKLALSFLGLAPRLV